MGGAGQFDWNSTRTFTLPHHTNLKLVTLLEWWVVQDDSAFGLALRAITGVMLSRFARLEPFRFSSFTISHLFTLLEWWVVQDSNLRPID
jgi:hypothetical protein